MSAAHAAPQQNNQRIIKAGETRSGKSVEPPASDCARSILKLWPAEDQASKKESPPTLPFAPCRHERDRLAAEAKRAANVASRFAAAFLDGVILALVTKQGVATRYEINRAVFGAPDITCPSDDLTCVALKRLADRGLIYSRFHHVNGTAFRWRVRRWFDANCELQRLRAILAAGGRDEQPGEGAADE